jgi:hypothetical protein
MTMTWVELRWVAPAALHLGNRERCSAPFHRSSLREQPPWLNALCGLHFLHVNPAVMRVSCQARGWRQPILSATACFCQERASKTCGVDTTLHFATGNQNVLDTHACGTLPSSFTLYLYDFGFSLGPPLFAPAQSSETGATSTQRLHVTGIVVKHRPEEVHPFDRTVAPLLQSLDEGLLPTDGVLDGVVPLTYVAGHVIVDVADFTSSAAVSSTQQQLAERHSSGALLRRVLLRPTTASTRVDLDVQMAQARASLLANAASKAARSGAGQSSTEGADARAQTAAKLVTFAAWQAERSMLVALYPKLNLEMPLAEHEVADVGVSPAVESPASGVLRLDFTASQKAKLWGQLTCRTVDAGAGMGARPAPPQTSAKLPANTIATATHSVVQARDDALAKAARLDAALERAAVHNQRPNQQQLHPPSVQQRPVLVGEPIYRGQILNRMPHVTGAMPQYNAMQIQQLQHPRQLPAHLAAATSAEQQRRDFESLFD